MRDELILPKFLDILIILDDEITYTKIYKTLPRCTDYLTRGLKYLEEKGIVQIKPKPDDARAIMIILTEKGRDAQRLVLTLYNVMGISLYRER